MKISELSTERTLDVLCEISPYAVNILSDEELLAELRETADIDKAETLAQTIVFTASKVSKLIPILLKKRKEDLFGIIGAINGKTYEEIAKQNSLKTMAQIRDVVKDKELLDFFKSCVSTEGSE